MAWTNKDRQTLNDIANKRSKGGPGDVNQPSDKGVAAVTGEIETIINDIKNEIAMLFGAVFFGTKNTVKDESKLVSKLNTEPPFITAVNSISKLMENTFGDKSKLLTETKGKIQAIIKNFDKIVKIEEDEQKQEQIQTQAVVGDKGGADKVELKITGISEGAAKSLQELFAILSVKNVEKDISKNATESLKGLTELFESLKKTADEIDKNEDIVKNIKIKYKEVNELFELVIKVSENAEKASIASAKIKKGVDDSADTAIGAADKGKDAKKSQVNLEQLAKVVLLSGFVMIIGALFFTWFPNLAKDAVKFGIVLGLFIVSTLGPLMLLTKLISPTISGSIAELNKIVVCAAAVMLIGAAFLMLGSGKYVKNALKFGLILGAFELCVLTPFVLFTALSKNAIPGISGLTKIILLSAGLMMLGAFITMDKKMIKNALTFGVILGLFELAVLSPYLLFATFSRNAAEGVKGLTGLILLSVSLMMLASLFTMDSKRIKNILMFGVILAAFELLLVAPYLLFAFFDKEVMKNLKKITALVILSVALMFIGYFVMKKKEIWQNALLFGVVLAAFELLMIAPFLLFNKFEKEALTGARDFAVLVLICAGALVLGPILLKVFKVSYGEVLGFAILLCAFTFLMGFVFKLILNMMNDTDIGKNMWGKNGALKKTSLSGMESVNNSIMGFAITVAVLAATITLGPVLLKMFHVQGEEVLGFTALLGLFTLAMSWIFIHIQESIKAITEMDGPKGAKTFFSKTALDGLDTINNSITKFAFFVAITAGIMTLGPILLKSFNIKFEDIGLFTGTLSLFVIAMAGIFLQINMIMSGIKEGGIVGGVLGFIWGKAGIKGIDSSVSNSLVDFALFTGLLAVTMTLGSVIIKEFGVSWEDILTFTGNLSVFVGIMSQIFALVIKEMSNITSEKNGSQILGFSRLLTGTPLEGGGSTDSPIFEFAKTTALLGAAMLMGPVVVKLAGIGYDDIGYFALELFGFVTAMSIVFVAVMSAMSSLNGGSSEGGSKPSGFIAKILSKVGLFGNGSESDNGGNDGELIKFALSTMILAAAVVVGPVILKTFKVDNGKVVGFCAIVSGFTLAMIKELKLLYKVSDKTIRKGAIVMGAISGIVLLMGLAFLAVSKAFSMIKGSPWKMLEYIGILALAVTALGAFMVGVGYVVSNPFVLGPLLIGASVIGAMSLVVSAAAVAVSDIANLKVACDWDKDGKPTKYRQLKKSDFDLVKKNLPPIMMVMAEAFVEVWKGKNGKPGLKDIASSRIIDLVIQFGVGAGQVIASLGEAVGKIAVLQVPDKWDKDGKPIHYMQLEPSHFKRMGINSAKILTAIGEALVSTYKLNEDLFDSDNTAITNIVNGMKGMTEVIGDITDVVIKIAECKVPDLNSYDPKTGKFTKYKQIELPKLQSAVKNNILGIIDSMVDTFSEIIKTHGNIFGLKTDWLSGAYESENPDEANPVLVVASGVKGITEVVGNIIDMFIKMAEVTVPDFTSTFDPKTGKWSKYKRFEIGKYAKDFKDNLKGIIDAIINAFASAVIHTGSAFGIKWDADDKKYELDEDAAENSPILAVVHGVGGALDVVGKIVDMFIKMSTTMVPDFTSKYDPKTGKWSNYKQFKIEDYAKDFKDNLKGIIDAIINAFAFAVKYTGSAFGIKWNAEDKKYEVDEDAAENSPIIAVVRGVGGALDAVGKIVDMFIKMSTTMVPDFTSKYDPKTGKWSNYKQFKIGDYSEDFKTNLGEIVSKIIDAFNDIATNQNYQPLFGLKLNDDGTFDLDDADEDNPIVIISNGFTGALSSVATFIDTIIKMATCMVPADNAVWDSKTGKWSNYKQFKLADYKTDIEENLESMIDAVIGAFNTVIKSHPELFGLKVNSDNSIDWSSIEDAEDNPIVIVGQGMNLIAGTIGSIVDTIIKIATCQYPDPSSYDAKTGKFTAYKTLNISEVIANLKGDNGILNQIMDVFAEAIEHVKSKFVGSDAPLSSTVLETIQSGMDSVTETISSVMEIVGKIAEFKYVTSWKNGEPADWAALDSNTLSVFRDRFVSMVGDGNPSTESAIGIIIKGLTSIHDVFKSNSFILSDDSADFGKNLDSIGGGLTSLADGLQDINEAIQKAQVNKEFEKNASNIGNFITNSVNKIDINRINKLISLTYALIKLANKTTNLDKLTNAIANNLTDALTFLTKKLTEAKTTIQLAEKIQAERHKKIDESIKKINEIMSKEIQVKVTAEAAATTTDGSVGGSLASPAGTTNAQTPSGTSGGGSTPSSPYSSAASRLVAADSGFGISKQDTTDLLKSSDTNNDQTYSLDEVVGLIQKMYKLVKDSLKK